MPTSSPNGNAPHVRGPQVPNPKGGVKDSGVREQAGWRKVEGKGEKLEQTKAKKLEKENQRKQQNQNPRTEPASYRCHKCAGRNHIAKHCNVAEDQLTARRQTNLARFGPMPDRKSSGVPRQSQTQQQQPSGQKKSNPAPNAATGSWAAKLGAGGKKTDPTPPKHSSRKWTDPALLRVQARELLKYADIAEEEAKCRRELIDAFFSAGAFQSICSWCGAMCPRPLLSEHMWKHKVTARVNFSTAAEAKCMAASERLAALRQAELTQMFESFKEGQRAITAKAGAKEQAKTLIAKADETKTDANKRARKQCSNTIAGPKVDSTDRCAAKAVLDMLCAAEILVNERSVLEAQPAGVPMSPTDILMSTSSQIAIPVVSANLEGGCIVPTATLSVPFIVVEANPNGEIKQNFVIADGTTEIVMILLGGIVAKDSHFSWTTPDQGAQGGVLVVAIFHHGNEQPQSTAWPQAIVPTPGQPWRLKGCGRKLCGCGLGFCDIGATECPLCLAQAAKAKPAKKPNPKSQPLLRDSEPALSEPHDLLAEAAAEDDPQPEETTSTADEGEETEATDDTSPQEATQTNASQWSHASVRQAQRGARCPFASCAMNYQPNARFAQAIISHIYHRHSQEEIRSVDQGSLASNGLVQCLRCGAIIPAPNSARSQHDCSRNPRERTRKAHLQQARQAFSFKCYEVWTDGSAKGDIAAAAAFFGVGNEKTCVQKCYPANNQVAELSAAILALRAVEPRDSVHIYTDSQWLIDGFTRKIAPDLHIEFWEELWSNDTRIQMTKVQGHSGIQGNEIADRIAGLVTGECPRADFDRYLEDLMPPDEIRGIAEKCLNAATFEPRDAVRWRYGDSADLQLEHNLADEWFRERPPSCRMLHKSQWGGFVKRVEPYLRGYSAGTPDQRLHKQLAFLDVPRTLLRKKGNHRGDTVEDLQATEARRLNRATILAEMGALGKASRSLHETGYTVAEPTPDVIARLQVLHPPLTGTDPIPTSRAHQIVGLQPHIVHSTVVHDLQKAAAPGLDGWTRELLLPIVKHRDLALELTRMIEDVLSGLVSSTFAARLRGVAVTALRKGRKIRSITPESCIAKLACAVAIRLLPDNAFAHLRPLQVGVGGNVEQAAVDIRAAIHARANALLFDATNAYNCLDRRCAMKALIERPALKPLHTIASILLSTQAFTGVYNRAGDLVARITATNGIRQGMLLGPILFALGIQPALIKTAVGNPGTSVQAYLDDISLVGDSPADVQRSSDILVGELRKLGIHASMTAGEEKCVFISRDPSAVVTIDGKPVPTPAPTEVTRFLGTALILDDSQRKSAKWLEEQVEEHRAFFNRLKDKRLSAQTRLALLIAAGAPRLNFLARTHTATNSAEAAKKFDAMILNCLESIVGRKLPPRALILAYLPIRFGGLGISRYEQICTYANDCVHEKGLQKKRGDEIAQTTVDSLKQTLSGLESALLASASSSSASRVLLDTSMRLSDRAMELYILQRLMLQVYTPTTKCVCGATASNQHILTCSRLVGGHRIHRHDAVITAIVESLATVGIPASTEPRIMTIRNRARPDIRSGQYVTDVTVKYDGADGGRAMEHGFRTKSAQWAEWSRLRDLIFCPIVMTTQGGIHPESLRWLRRVIGEADSSTLVRPTMEHCINRMVSAVLTYNVGLFASAVG